MQLTRRGDTLIEVLFGFAVFSLVVIAAVSLMNNGLNTAERTLELTMSRNEINNQAEALRFLHGAYVAELSNNGTKYGDIWRKIVSQTSRTPITITSCSDDDVYHDTTGFFAINFRNLGKTTSPNDIVITPNPTSFQSPTTYARLTYGDEDTFDNRSVLTTTQNIQSIDGLWVTVVPESPSNPSYWDFYIQSCWYAPGDHAPSTLDTVVRLYNPKGTH